MEVENSKSRKIEKKKAINRKIQLPKGNWTKQIKLIPPIVKETAIIKHHYESKAKKHLTLGYRMFKANKVSQVFLSPGSKSSNTSTTNNNTLYIKGKVERSFTLNSKYDTAIKLKTTDSSIETAWCGCKAGEGGVCKHVGAVLWFLLDCKREGRNFIPDDQACTERARSWSAPSNNKKLASRSFNELDFIRHDPGKSSEVGNKKKENYSSLANIETSEDEGHLKKRIEVLTRKLRSKNIRNFLCEIQEENDFKPAQTHTPIISNVEIVTGNVKQICLPLGLLELDSNILTLMETTLLKTPDILKLPLDAAINLEIETRQQSNCLLWNAERKARVTVSKFGSICKRRKEVNEGFLKTIFNGADLSRNKYVQEGLTNELLATKKYDLIHGNTTTFAVGLCVNPTLPMLGASPDRLVYQENIGFGLLEIKTLSKCKERGLSIEEAMKSKCPTTMFKKK